MLSVARPAMSQTIVSETTEMSVAATLAGKQPYTEQISQIALSDDESQSIGECELTTAVHYENLIAKAIEVQSEIEGLIGSAREQESQRLASLSTSMRELEQNQTVTLLLLGMLNRRVLYEYNQEITSEDNEYFDASVNISFEEEISLLRRTVADVMMSEAKSNQLLDCNLSDIEAVNNRLDEMRAVFEVLAAQADGSEPCYSTDLTLKHIITQTRELFLTSYSRSKNAAESEKVQLDRLRELSEPLWDVCTDIRAMCDVLEREDFGVSRDAFLRKLLNFANGVPRQWPQATDFRCEVRSDVRSNLGLEKYGELRWHSE